MIRHTLPIKIITTFCKERKNLRDEQLILPPPCRFFFILSIFNFFCFYGETIRMWMSFQIIITVCGHKYMNIFLNFAKTAILK